MVVPSEGKETTSNVPFNSTTRSRIPDIPDPLFPLSVTENPTHWVGTAPPMAGLLRLVCAIPPSEPDVRLSPHPALHQMG